jgi:hypothetical protein
MPAARAAAIAATVRGRSTKSSAISVRSRSHANAATSRGKPSGRTMLTAARDEGRDVGDLLVAQITLERRHPAAAVPDLLDHLLE